MLITLFLNKVRFKTVRFIFYTKQLRDKI